MYIFPGKPIAHTVKTVLVPAKTSFSCSSCGPLPTIASRTFGNLSLIVSMSFY